MRDFLGALNGAIQVERLPGYAPELNPNEYMLGHLKTPELNNYCALNFATPKQRCPRSTAFDAAASHALPRLLAQAELPI